MDVIKLDVPLFIRLLELAREVVKNDEDLHDIAEIVAKMSADHDYLTMEHYKKIVNFMRNQGADDELTQIRKLGGMSY